MHPQTILTPPQAISERGGGFPNPPEPHNPTAPHRQSATNQVHSSSLYACPCHWPGPLSLPLSLLRLLLLLRPVVRSVRVRLRTLTFHGYARLRTLTPQPSARLCMLGLGDTEGDLLCSSAQVLCRKTLVKKILRALCADKALKGLSGKKKNVHACARLDREMAHTYTHLPPNTAHA